MAVRKAPANKFVDPLYGQGSYPPISTPSAPAKLPTKVWGAGDPNASAVAAIKAGKKYTKPYPPKKK